MAGVLYALASYIENTLTEMATEEVHMLLGVSGEIDYMGNKLRDLKNFLADADRRNITDQSVQEWVKELRDAMYDATNILDLCQLKAMERGPERDAGCFNPLFFCFNPLLFCLRNPLHAHDIGSRIKNLNQKLDGIKARSASFNFINLSTYEDHGRSMVPNSSGTRQTSWGLDEKGLVGEMIEEDTRKIVELLTNKEDQTHRLDNKIMIFAIVGVGGIGKTTLARKIFNNDIVQQEFSKKIWLSVNQDFNDLDILRRAITEAGGDYHVAGDTKATLERILAQTLLGHKILIIMDDVWDYRAWEDVLRTPMLSIAAANNGCRVLITTRDNRVARGMMAEQPYHCIKKLEPQDAWLLLMKQVGLNINDDAQVKMLKKTGMDIIEKCDCLPLAVKVIGGILRQKTTRQVDWEKVLHDFLSVSQMPIELNNAIYLSYEDLQPSLKPCFLYYSILPRNAFFSRHDIVAMWISEGFIHGSSCDLEEKGREYIDELIQRNLIEPDMKYLDQAVCSMHDIVRSFAQHIARDEALVCHNTEVCFSDKLKSQKFIRLSMDKEGSQTHDFEWSSLQTQNSLRTLISAGLIKIRPGDSLLSFPSLRTLHLVSVNFDELGESLYQLKHLRYLSIEKGDISMLPENIVNLKFLQYIRILDCGSFVKLPTSIGVLQHLRHLEIRGTSMNTIPKGFCGLTCLRNLYGFPAHMDGDWCSLEELGPLSQLMNVTIHFLANVASASFATEARLGEKNHLREVSLNCTPILGNDGLLVNADGGISEEELRRIEGIFDELCPPPCIENIYIDGYFGQRFPCWMMLTEAVMPLRNLMILAMTILACCTELPSVLSQLPSLEQLQIQMAPAIKHVGHEFLQPYNRERFVFPRLQELYFIGLVEWEQWVWEEHLEAMPMLKKLYIALCKLRRVPPGLAFHASALQELHIKDVKNLSSLENFTSVVHLEVHRNTDLERIINLPKLQKLEIVKCPKMKVLQGMQALHRLCLEDYDMQTVPRYLLAVNPRHLELECSLSLLTCIAAGKSGPEWEKFSHIQQVKGYAHDEGSRRKWYVLYTRDPFRFETNISRSAIAKASIERVIYACHNTCSIEEDPSVGGHVSADKRQPLCLRFRCNAYRHLVVWLHSACLHCNEAWRVASSSNQWIESTGYPAARTYPTLFERWRQQNAGNA